jgi:hypothetical protein
MTLIKRLHSMSPRQKGSALLVTLMVIVGLSMLGLGFVAMSETESSISVNQRNYAQAQVVSEAGARIVVDWFNQPERIDALGLMPTLAQQNALLRERFIDLGTGTAENVGRWKYNANFFCCDKPYRPATVDRLYGTYWSPDVLIDQSTAEGRTFLASFNDALFPVEFDAGTPPRLLPNSYSAEVTEIRIYAPPIIGAVNTPNDINGTVPAGQGFYDESPAGGSKGTRYGLATVAVTAQVRRLPRQLLSVTGNRVLSERTTRIVISEWPFPGPQGPVQSNANIQTGGAVVVHWGKMTSQGDMEVKREFQGLPWMDAHQRIPWWYGGNDTSRLWPAAGGTIRVGDVIRPTDGSIAADHNYWAEACAGACAPGGTEPVWPATGSIVDGTITWTRRNPAQFEVVGVSAAADYPVRMWGDEILGRTFEDPWVEARARQRITNTPNTDPEPFKWDYVTNPLSTNAPSPKKTGWTQFQDRTDPAPSSYKEVVFPKIDYVFWKELAIAGQGTEGVFYFRWVADDRFSRNGVVDTFKNWTNTATGAKPGFYFFDTRNAQNPQVPGGDAYLTPAIDIRSQGGTIWTAMGFIYVNTAEFGSQGIRGVDGWFNFPGDPFLDKGHLLFDPTTSPPTLIGGMDPNTVGNRYWDYFDFNGNGKFDLWLEQKPVTRLDGATTATVWRPVQWFEGCNVQDNAITAGACASPPCCSDPHEPFLNMIYPTRTEGGVLIADACCSGLLPKSLTMGWQAPGSVTKLPKKLVPPSDTVPNCNGTDFDIWDNIGRAPVHCTSNYYDRNGAMDWWAGTQDAPILNGVMYIAGNMRSQGNARFFGSLLINGDVDNVGTNEVWFDERLIKDEWPPAEWPFPRVFVTAVRTDDL